MLLFAHNWARSTLLYYKAASGVEQYAQSCSRQNTGR